MHGITVEVFRRGVVRVIGAYLAVAWLVIQLGAVLESSLGLPAWFDAVVTSFALLGFPVAVVIAWAFEVTPEGVKRTEGSGKNGISYIRVVTDSAILITIVSFSAVTTIDLLRDSPPVLEEYQEVGKENESLVDRPVPKTDNQPELKVVVRGGNEQPVQNAQIILEQSGRVLNAIPLRTDFRGALTIQEEVDPEVVFFLVISADNFRQRRVRVDPHYSWPAIVEVDLVEAASLNLSGPIHNLSVNQKLQFVDLHVKHTGFGDITVVKLRLNAVKRRQTKCLDGAPSLLINLQEDSEQGSWFAESLTTSDRWSQQVMISGDFEVLPCRQKRMGFSLKGFIRFSEGNVEKIRLSVPRALSTPDGKKHVLDLENWAGLSVALEATDGQVYSTSK